MFTSEDFIRVNISGDFPSNFKFKVLTVKDHIQRFYFDWSHSKSLLWRITLAVLTLKDHVQTPYFEGSHYKTSLSRITFQDLEEASMKRNWKFHFQGSHSRILLRVITSEDFGWKKHRVNLFEDFSSNQHIQGLYLERMHTKILLRMNTFEDCTVKEDIHKLYFEWSHFIQDFTSNQYNPRSHFEGTYP